MPPRDFYPYHPLRLRLGLALGAAVSLGLAAWAGWSFRDTQSLKEALRAGLSLGLGLAMAFTCWRYRPRPAWGVRVTPVAVLVSRPRRGQLEVPLAAVREVRRLGKRRDTLSLWLARDQRVVVPAHLFASRREFDALASHLEAQVQPTVERYDA